MLKLGSGCSSHLDGVQWVSGQQQTRSSDTPSHEVLERRLSGLFLHPADPAWPEYIAGQPHHLTPLLSREGRVRLSAVCLWVCLCVCLCVCLSASLSLWTLSLRAERKREEVCEGSQKREEQLFL